MNGNKSAYPDPMRGCPENESNQRPWELSEGLTKREIFAMAAMQGILAGRNPEYATNPEFVSEWSLQQADALLAALEK